MHFFKYFAVAVFILALVFPTEAWLRRAFRKAKKAVKKVAKKVVKAVKKVVCKVVWGVGCPFAVGAIGTAVSTATSGAGAPLIGLGVALGKHGCRVKKRKCKRSVDMDFVMIPFSDEMSDYDMNGDKRISYHEFVLTVLNSVDMVNADELMEPFMFSDFNGDGELDTDEFKGAPLLFGHADRNMLMYEMDYDSPAAA